MIRQGKRVGGAATLLVAVLALLVAIGTAPVHAAVDGELRPCQNVPVAGDEGEAELGLSPGARNRLGQSGLRSSLLGPARWLGGVPVFPVRSASEAGDSVTADLAGGFVIRGSGGRRMKVNLSRLVKQGSSDARIEGRIDGRNAILFRVQGIAISRNEETGQVELDRGRVILTAAMAKRLKRGAGLRGVGTGFRWGSLYLTWDEVTPPSVSVPEEPQAFPRPAGATDLSAATLTWRVRPSWIQYVASGSAPEALRGAVPGATETIDSQPPLVYEFTFPFSSGWVKDGGAGVESASVTGSGGVYFRYCGSSAIYKGINFIVHSPEFELEGDSARLIFRVEGIDATPFPDTRVVVVDLAPDAQASQGPVTTWTGIPGSVPTGARGVFAGFYAAGADFGSVTVTVDRGAG